MRRSNWGGCGVRRAGAVRVQAEHATGQRSARPRLAPSALGIHLLATAVLCATRGPVAGDERRAHPALRLAGGASLGSTTPAKGSTHRRPGPKKVLMPLPAPCSICFSLSHRRPACPDAMLSEIESELEPDDPAITAREHLTRSLLAVCKVGNVTQADELVAAGASVNAADKRNLLDSALHRAAYWGHAGLVTRLLHHGADIALRNRLDYTALHWAAVRGKSDVLRALLAAAADVHAVDVEGNTALHFAAREGFPDIVGELIQAGARVNSVTTVWKYTPVIYAAMGGELACLLHLAAHCADLKIKCAKGLDALGWATALERVECAEILSRLLGMEEDPPTFLNLTEPTPELRELEAIGLLNIGPPHDVTSFLLLVTSLLLFVTSLLLSVTQDVEATGREQLRV
jgi:hypothetical protein